MELNARERDVLAALAEGLPLAARPYAAIGEPLGLSEDAVIAVIDGLIGRGVVSRFGLVVRHHELGYRANAMVVWDVDDREVAAVGRLLATYPCITLCYRRPRRPPAWRYNLFCMVHGQDRAEVQALVDDIAADLDLAGTPHELLFSRRRFKQRGARYAPIGAPAGAA